MTGQDMAIEQDALRELWQRWVEVIRLFALRRGRRRWLSERAYQALHQSLIEACRSLASAADGEARAFYERLESIAQPWMALHILERAERDILFDLLQSSQQAGRELGRST